jgi:hypothetical protein
MTRAVKTEPTMEILEAIAADRGLDLDRERIEAALEMHAKFRHELDLLRSVDLSPLPPYIQPETALRWIENGGRLP